MAPQNIYDFSDNLNIDRKSRDNFISEYVDLLADDLTDEEIIARWKTMVYNELLEEACEIGTDNIVREVAEKYPKWIETQFNVDVSLAQV